MPRDASGVYTLPPSNPVVTGTIIASTWANSTMSDIAAQLNNVLTRDGLLGPTGPFKLQDGTVAAPGLAWASEPGLGWYRKGAGSIGVASGGVSVSDIATSADTNFSLYPKAAGASSQLLLYNQPSASIANANIFSIWVQPSGYVFREVLSGTATAKPLTMNFPAGVFVPSFRFVKQRIYIRRIRWCFWA